MSDQETMKHVLLGIQAEGHNDIKRQLEFLRKTRAQRGGVGEPLAVPAHLRAASHGQGIIITDSDLDPNKQLPLNPRIVKEMELDARADHERELKQLDKESE